MTTQKQHMRRWTLHNAASVTQKSDQVAKNISVVPIHLFARYKCKVEPNTVEVLKNNKKKI